MQLKRFEVRGFKNLTSTLELDDLGSINVIHGDNNVGKSNLLQAMAVFFRALSTVGQMHPPFGTTSERYPLDLQGLDVEARDLFNLISPADILVGARLSTTPDDLQAAGVTPPTYADEIDVALQLSWDGSQAVARVTRFQFEGGLDFANWNAEGKDADALRRFARALATNVLIRSAEAHQFAIVGTRRDADADLGLQLFDAREAVDLQRANRWRRFVEEMRSFADITGPGDFIVTFDRAKNAARLLFEDATARTPLKLMGTGVQQLAAVLGHLLMTNASIVAVEEPELNLRYTLQLELRESLRRLVGSSGGPSQIFLTSHSPAFESGDTFYAMRAAPDGPTIERRPVAEAAQFTEHLVDVPRGRAPLSYVTSEGLVKLPDGVRKQLGIEQGGGVVFRKRDDVPYVELLTNEQFMSALRGEDGDAEPAKG
jgi:predicted ATPase